MSSRIFQGLAPSLLRGATRGMRKKNPEKRTTSQAVSSLFMPAPLKPGSNSDDINVGAELGAEIDKNGLRKALNEFHKRPEVIELAAENGLDSSLFQRAFQSFRQFCETSEKLDAEFHIVCSDLLRGSGHVTDIFPYFLRHAKQVFPHVECMDELKKISDLRLPANWYPEARSVERKFIFHAGPTNSGKTYHAMEAFISASNGVYCGPLKMLAVEVYQKTNARGTSCDLVTGEERRRPNGDMPSSHVACTVEMTSTKEFVDVAIIDEIQMVKDPQRGWAWTRALLGIPAKEVHLCGEEAAIPLIREILAPLGEQIEVRNYERLTPLVVEKEALRSLSNLQPGDCVVCFNKNDIYTVSLEIERMDKQCAIIYGSLSPGTKSAQSEKFNDPDHPCKILVATDAIGMGLNLSIRRIIFYNVTKPNTNEKGVCEREVLSVSQALQIAGRAGRFGTAWSEGRVTTMKPQDLPILTHLLNSKPETIAAAGLHPTADQIELFAYHLPHANLSNLIDIFCSLSRMNNAQYFMCNVESLKYLADLIQHVNLPLRARYVFCCAPINPKMPFVTTVFLKYARQYSRNEPVTCQRVHEIIGWPLKSPENIVELVHLEAVFDVVDLYLWLSYRFQDLFPEQERVRELQIELDEMIQGGVVSFTRLLRAVTSADGEKAVRRRPRRETKKVVPENASATKLTDSLISRGLITEDELKMLQEEWLNSSKPS
ncbi:ATP-dependent RNA helicase SUV3 homolog, mitochondrial [Galendromus occidentalis]|uniref:ATP-dependent RNA helicase SUV3 homolog, mitochondrial n=1 Tax=Galendromus occidentalis TaxID=34638 RepID=A0AAJ6QUF9_9ACAR|nr:ATP-dependent RNA helicase SUV3 homolog, mitochondrial [Galendromus occidentalis]